MNERPTDIERYQAMTPQERNAEMKQLLDLFPDNDSVTVPPGELPPEGLGFDRIHAFYKAVDNEAERRRKSQLKQILIGRLENLLSFAAVTDSFKVFIADEFDDLFEAGVDRSIGETPIYTSRSFLIAWYELLQWDNPESGGIFEKDRGKDIEKSAYELEVMKEFPSMHYMIDEALQATGEFLKEWRAEFIKRHGEDP